MKQYHALPLQENNGIQVLTYQFSIKTDVNALKVLIDDYKTRYSNILIFFVDMTDSTQQKLVVGVSNDLHNYYQANRIVQQLNPFLDGKGGGNNSVAQTGFKNKAAIAKLLADPLGFLQQHG